MILPRIPDALYGNYRETAITNRFFDHSSYRRILERHRSSDAFRFGTAGYSAEGREISLISWGTGPVTIMLWSQMHGDEATASMCFADLFRFFATDDELNAVRQKIWNECTLHFIPMLNPDGAERFTRRNAQGIDINRDFLHCQSPEAATLKGWREKLQPAFAFNLHDQTVQWSAGHSGKPASISLLAPAFDEALSINPVRGQAMQVIAGMYEAISDDIPGHIGLFDDEFEPRAFGDNFQKAGTSTILVEAGGYPADPEKQFIRQVYFKAVLAGLWSIASGEYQSKNLDEYTSIPANRRKHCSILLKNCLLNVNAHSYRADIALQAIDRFDRSTRSVSQEWQLYDLGDLSLLYGYDTVDAGPMEVVFDPESPLDKAVTIEVVSAARKVLSIRSGVLMHF